ncbi:ABC transporter ATP-binding protein [Curtobacterium caseinilyticum]|uniref:ATP-binding cassette domain-containing protein n=1 Tax=Curtobacterium caseinilyticum TaxID=3055137 RepID=A0ABT7TP79_9MICO|nr:ATP-binding cassette domain-containing protein [Curtobacterium caseinilyticum]MDM7891396.1 ATP-binding cassette domain-containing protein [Curtobacterium caseinilyticum]
MVNAAPVLEVDGLGFDVGPRRLWNELSLSVRPGDAVAVLGPSGQGKSTLLRCLGGLQAPTRGFVRLLGEDVHRSARRTRRSMRRDRVGFIVQDHAVVPQWTIAQNLSVVRPSGLPRIERDERVRDAAHAVGLGGRLRMRAGFLSGGEQQRVAVARVLVQRPMLVLADEPTASLDETSAGLVRDGLERLRSAGSAIVVATHEVALQEWAGGQIDL